MKARPSEPFSASAFFYGPPDRRRRRPGRRQPQHSSPQPDRPQQAASAVRGTPYATPVEVGIPRTDPSSYRGHMRRKPILLALIVSAFFLLNLPGASSAPPTLVAPALSASVTGTEVSLTWTDAGRETSYYVVRLPPGGVTWTTIAQLKANILQYKDSGLSPSTTYQYIVVATRGWKQVNSNAVQVTTGDTPSLASNPSPSPSPTSSPSPSPSPSPLPSPSPSYSPSPSLSPSPSPSPSPSSTSCSGVTVVPTSDIQALLNLYPSGTTFCFQTGTYVLKSVIVPKSYDSLIGLPGAVLTGLDTYAAGIKGWGGSTGQHDVTVRGFVVEHFLNNWSDTTLQAPISPGANWIIENNVVRYNAQAGISASGGTVIRGNEVVHNGHIGITGGAVRSVRIKGNEIAFNNTGSYDVNVHAGGAKITGESAGSSNIVFRGNYVHDNTGNGLWLDTNVRNVTIETNTIENNSAIGIFYEQSWDAVIRNNVVRNNAVVYAGTSCYSGAQIHVNDSQNVEIYGNTVAASNGANGICAVDIDREVTAVTPNKVANLYVHDNVIKVRLSGTSGLVGRPASYDASANNRFANNTYYVTDKSNKAWAWSTYPVTWSRWRGYGNDRSGRLLVW
jgi:parallel beta-helix repeat protein